MAKLLNLIETDLQPYYYAKVVDNNGGIDLSGASIVCSMKNLTDGTLKINRQSAGIVIDPDQVANIGQFKYEWQAGDTDTPDNYCIEFEITPAAGGKFTIPASNSESPALVNINESLDTS